MPDTWDDDAKIFKTDAAEAENILDVSFDDTTFMSGSDHIEFNVPGN